MGKGQVVVTQRIEVKHATSLEIQGKLIFPIIPDVSFDTYKSLRSKKKRSWVRLKIS